ncbi:MAG: hypothetical protein ABIQ95_10080 [Bdellovibrionia bacterium]
MKKIKCIFAAAVLAGVSASSAFAETETSQVTVFQNGSAGVRIVGSSAKALFDLMDVPVQGMDPNVLGPIIVTKVGKRMVCSARTSGYFVRVVPIMDDHACVFLALNDGDFSAVGETNTNALR